jgi:hypothetical protein
VDLPVRRGQEQAVVGVAQQRPALQGGDQLLCHGGTREGDHGNDQKLSSVG